jgi:hypothetical protein
VVLGESDELGLRCLGRDAERVPVGVRRGEDASLIRVSESIPRVLQPELSGRPTSDSP